MASYYFSANIDNETILCISPLTSDRLIVSGQEIPDQSGYFLYEARLSQEPADVRILAQLVSEEAAFEMSRMLRLA